MKAEKTILTNFSQTCRHKYSNLKNKNCKKFFYRLILKCLNSKFKISFLNIFLVCVLVTLC